MNEVRRGLKVAPRQMSLHIKAVQQAMTDDDPQSVEARLRLLIDSKVVSERLDLEMSDHCEKNTDSDAEDVADEECQKTFT